jgi:hypothetical protein
VSQDASLPNTIEATMAMGEHVAVLTDWAKALRISLEADGWSPTMAEHLAAEMLVELFRKAMRA